MLGGGAGGKFCCQQGEAQHLGRSNQHHSHKRAATTHTVVLEKQSIHCSGSESENKPDTSKGKNSGRHKQENAA